MSKQKTPNAQQNFSDFVKSLKGSNSTLYENVDITCNIPNALAISNQMLIFLLAKTSSVPLVKDFTKFTSELGITPEEANSIQKINSDIILLQNMILTYCIQQYMLGSMMKLLIDELIGSVPEIKDIQSIDEFTEYMMNFEKTQIAGGQKGGCGMICRIIIMLYLILVATMPSETEAFAFWSSSTPTPEPTTQPNVNVNANATALSVSIVESKNGVTYYSNGIASIDVQKVHGALMNMPQPYISPMNISKIMVKYDSRQNSLIKRSYNDVVKFLGFQGDLNSDELIENFVEEWNKQAKIFAKSAQGQCLDIMRLVRDNGGYDDMYNIDDAAAAAEKVDNANKEAEKAQADLDEDSLKWGVGTTVAVGGIAVVTAPLWAPVLGVGTAAGSLLAATGTAAVNLVNYVSNSDEIEAEKIAKIAEVGMEVGHSSPLANLTKSQKITAVNGIYHFSELYCLYGYDLHMEWNKETKTIQLFGPKISYELIAQFTNSIKSNIEYKKNKLDKDSTQAEVLDSLYQRLEILSVMSFEANKTVSILPQVEINRELRSPDADSLGVVKTVFDKNLKKLNKLAELAGEKKPIDLSNIQEAESIQIAKLNVGYREIAMGYASIQYQQAKDKLYNNGVAAIVEGWTGTILSPIVGVVSSTGTELGKSLRGLLGGAFGELLKDCPVWAIGFGAILLIAIGACVVGNQISMFTDVGGKVWMVITSPLRGIAWVFQVALSAGGFILKPMGAIFNRGKRTLGLVDGPPGGPDAYPYPNITRNPTRTASTSNNNITRNPTRTASASNINTITVQVKDPNNAAVFHPYTLDPNSTVRELKQQIAQQLSYPVANRQLQYRDLGLGEWIVLNDNDTFVAKGINDQTQIKIRKDSGGKRLSRKIKTNMHKNVTKKRRFRVKGNKKTKKNRKRVTKHRK